MLKKHSQAFLSLLVLTDALVTSLAWIGAYLFRFYAGVVPLEKGVPDPLVYLTALPWAALLSVVCYRYAGLYKLRREGNAGELFLAVARGTLLALGAVLAVTFFYREYEYSRAVVVLFAGCNVLLLYTARIVLGIALRALRTRGLNVRKALIVGAGKLGQKLVESLNRNPWTGIEPVGYVDPRPERRGATFIGRDVLGAIEDVPTLIERHGIEQVFIALPGRHYALVESVMDLLAETMVDVRIVPDLFSYDTLNREVGEFDGLPVLSLRESPLYGWNRALKRLIDVAFSFCILVLLSPLLLLLALAVKVSSAGPVFYRQKRMGLGGDVFEMLKFRSMRVDAEAETGAVWAKENDPRRTRFGTFLRRTSLDELPQFLNVLLGDMSVVGPRPERPVFIQEFKGKIPRYMFRHKMKAGITGWAQVNGWRGNTSLRKRIQYDLYYIENWSIWFDVQIIFLTVFRGLVGKNAY
jgi:Undecaprenyl-phosphate glucose phosphotransferase